MLLTKEFLCCDNVLLNVTFPCTAAAVVHIDKTLVGKREKEGEKKNEKREKPKSFWHQISALFFIINSHYINIHSSDFNLFACKLIKWKSFFFFLILGKFFQHFTVYFFCYTAVASQIASCIKIQIEMKKKLCCSFIPFKYRTNFAFFSLFFSACLASLIVERKKNVIDWIRKCSKKRQKSISSLLVFSLLARSTRCSLFFGCYHVNFLKSILLTSYTLSHVKGARLFSLLLHL